jgi:AGZA family xanthine/uracil permease-like MFS transporter
LPVLLAFIGFAVMIALDYRRMPGAIVIGILLVTVAGIVFGANAPPPAIVDLPPSIAPTLFALDIKGFFNLAGATMLILLFSFLLVDLFDTAGTLIAVAHQADMLDEDGNLPRLGPALVADSSATVVGALLGTSTTTSYIESAAGVREGGRTGLTAVTVAVLFLLALFFAPVATSIPAFATAPAIVFVACIMARGLAELDWDDVTEYAPAVITALAMPLTFSIATGIGLGFIAYVAIKLLCGRLADIGAAMWLIGAIFVIYFATV